MYAFIFKEVNDRQDSVIKDNIKVGLQAMSPLLWDVKKTVKLSLSNEI